MKTAFNNIGIDCKFRLTARGGLMTKTAAGTFKKPGSRATYALGLADNVYAARYHTLVVRNEDGHWYPQFGDYDRQCVIDEKDSYLVHGTRVKDTKIVTTGDHQSDITAAIKKLNE